MSSREAEVPLAQVEHGVTDLKGLIYFQEHRLRDLRAIDQGPIPGTEILKQETIFLARELAMAARSFQVLDDYVTIWSTSNHH